MDDLVKYFDKMAQDLGILAGDVERIIANKKEEGSGKKEEDKKKMSMKSMQPVTRFHKNKEELIEAQKNPDLDFINSKIEDIFGK